MDKSNVYIFISYSHSDFEFVSKLSDRLYEAGIPHFRDVKEIKWGESIPKRIHQELEKATHLLICISPGSEQSQWVAYEMGYAKGKNVTLVPYLLHPKMKIPGFIQEIKCLASFEEEAEFIKSLSTKLSYELTFDKHDAISNDIITGYYKINVDTRLTDRVISTSNLPLEDIDTKYDIKNKSYVVLRTDSGSSILTRFDNSSGNLVKLKQNAAFGVKADNNEHNIALDLLLDDAVKVVVLIGDTETEKRYLSFAAGLEKVAEENKYNRLTVTRCISMKLLQLQSNEYFPGDIEERLAPLHTPLFDEIERLLTLNEKDRRHSKGYKELMAMGLMDIEIFGTLLGRRFSNQYIIIDDSQNMTVDNMTNMIKSTNNNAKLVFLCDLNNVINEKVNNNNSGVDLTP